MTDQEFADKLNRDNQIAFAQMEIEKYRDQRDNPDETPEIAEADFHNLLRYKKQMKELGRDNMGDYRNINWPVRKP